MRDTEFRWTFRPGPQDSEIIVVGPERSGGRLVATLRGWRDPWLALDAVELVGEEMHLSSSASNSPAVVGPGFVRSVIADALDAGWEPLTRGAGMHLEYEGRASSDQPGFCLKARRILSREDV